MSNITDTITNTISEALIEEEDPCLSLETEEYNLDLHIISIFVIMILSFIGTLLPLIAKKIPALKIRQVPFYCAKMFGAGVILATALVHMLTPAFENLSHECLPEAFGEDGYGAWPGAICLMSICVIHLIQFLAAREVRKLQAQQSSNPSSNNGGGSPGHSHSHGTPKDKPMVGASEETTIEEGGEKQKQEEPTFDVHEHGDTDHVEAHDFIALKEKQISTYILEAGVASHSIIVGLTLGVARAEFNSLFIALTFHQFFEGIALSAVVLDTISKHKNIQTIFVIIFYSLTTPIGIAIGIGISESFNSAEASGLIAQGVLDAIAAGILLYDGLVNVIVPHFKSDRFAKDPTWFQITQWAFFWFGGAIMSLIGKWA